MPGSHTRLRVSGLRILLAVSITLILTAGLLPPAAAQADFGSWSLSLAATKIQAIAIDPSNDQTVYAAGANGLWKTTNSGANWNQLGNPSLSLIAVDPFAHDTLYAISGNTVIKSTNGGNNWSTIYTSQRHLNDLILDPYRTNTLYVSSGSVTESGSTPARIVRSGDGGASWSVIAESSDSNFSGSSAYGRLAMIPGVPDLLYATFAVYHGGGILKTANANAAKPSWVQLSSPHSPAPLDPGDLVVAGTPSDRAIYSSWAGPMGASELALHENDVTLVQIGNRLPFDVSGSAYSYITALAVNPGQANWLYAAIQSGPRFKQPEPPVQYGVFASPDRGQTWTELGHLAQPVSRLELAVRSHTLYAVTAAGIYQMMIAWPVDTRFSSFYTSYDGLRLLGAAISAATVANTYPAQYFEKGRLEDHQGESSDPNWRFMYGLLVDELQQARVALPVGGDSSSLTYAGINALADPAKRLAFACPGSCPNGVWVQNPADGTVFIPFTADLHSAPGHLVLGGFWNYMNRHDLFPGGWLHDVGLPIMEPQEIVVTKNLPGGPVTRKILVQAFQRTILTYDPANPPEWQIERANAGSDYRIAFPERVGP